MGKADKTTLILVIPVLKEQFTLCFFSSAGKEAAALFAPGPLGWSHPLFALGYLHCVPLDT